MYKNYIFDLYGTLIDINTDEKKEKVWIHLSELYGFYGAHYTPKELRQSYETLCKNTLHTPSSHQYPEIVIEDIFQQLFLAKQIHITKELAIHTGQFFRILSTSYIRLYDHAIPLLQSLKDHGRNIYVLSNAQRIFTEYEMKYLGIYDRFDGIVLSSDEGCMKPDPDFYQIVLDRYHLDKQDSIMIGNDSLSDIKGATTVGLDSLYLDSNLSPAISQPLQATYVLDPLDLKAAETLLLNH